jgi:hypothetical protein
MRWLLSTESVGVRRLSLTAGIVSALYEFGYCFIHPPEGQWWGFWATTDVPDVYQWGFWASVAVLCSFYFLCTWVPIRIVAWIVSGFVYDARKKSN